MKIIFSENIPSYTQYLFPYSVYGLRETGDQLVNIYAHGFLPTRIDEQLFYLARSTRIESSKFSQTSELRRVARKTEGLNITRTPISEFNYDFTIGKWMKDFYDVKFGEKTMSAQKAKWLFTSGSFTDILTFTDGTTGKVIGYCVVNYNDKIMHYAYPFYELECVIPNIGLGMMLRAVEMAQTEGLEFVYLGTTYTENSLYKTQFPGFSWFDGIGWNSDLVRLKKTIREIPESNPFIGNEGKSELAKQSNLTIDLS